MEGGSSYSHHRSMYQLSRPRTNCPPWCSPIGWAWWFVSVAVLVLIAVGIFYYPAIFPPSAQTPLGFLENDLYMGLLVLAEYLWVQRRRGVRLEV